ncbi:hypothetical protein JCM8547_008192 [Rhodosporidiobolus lusitaniae]
MLSPGPSSPPPRRRRRRRPVQRKPAAARVEPSPPPNAADSPDLATLFHGLRPVGGDAERVVEQAGHVAAGTAREKREEEGVERVEPEEKEDLWSASTRRGAGGSGAPVLPSTALRRSHNPIPVQLDATTASSSSSLRALPFPPPAQTSTLRRTLSSLTPLPSTSSSSSSSSSSRLAAPAQLEPVAGPCPKENDPPPPVHERRTLSPSTVLRTGRRGSIHGRVPDPLWAARVLSPIVRAEVAAAEAEAEAARKRRTKEEEEEEQDDEISRKKRRRSNGKSKGKGKEKSGWRTLSEGSEAREDAVPLSVDEFLVNVLPKTKEVRKAKEARRRRGNKGKGEETEPARRRQRAAYTSSGDEEALAAYNAPPASGLYSPSEIFAPAPPPRPLHGATTFLGALDLSKLDSRGKTRLLRRQAGEMKEPLSLGPASKTVLGREGKGEVGRAEKGGKGKGKRKKGKEKEEPEEGRNVERLPPGKDVRAPFISSIGQTGFAPLKGGGYRSVLLERKRASGRGRRKSLAQIEEEVEVIVFEDGAEGPPLPPDPRALRRVTTTLFKKGGGRVETLELGKPEEAGAPAADEAKFSRMPARQPFKPKTNIVRKPPPSSGAKYRFTPQRLPPPRLLNLAPSSTIALPSHHDHNAHVNRSASSDAFHPSAEKVEPPAAFSSSTSLPPPPAAYKPPQTEFRFITGAKAKKAPTIEAQRARTIFSSSSSQQQLVFDSPPPARTTRRLPSTTVQKTKTKGRLFSNTPSQDELVTPARPFLPSSSFSTTSKRHTESDPEGEPKRKKRHLLRRLTTRPDFRLPFAVPVEPSLEQQEEDHAVHQSSHEFSGARARSGGSVSLPPQLQQRPSSRDKENDNETPSLSKRSRLATSALSLPAASPELYAPSFDLPVAAQSHSRSRLQASGFYSQADSPSSASRKYGDVDEPLEAAFDAAHALIPLSALPVAATTGSSSSPFPPNPLTRHLPLQRRASTISSAHLNTPLRHLGSTQSSGLWTHVPSLPSYHPDGLVRGGEEGNSGNRRSDWSSFSAAPSFVGPTPGEDPGNFLERSGTDRHDEEGEDPPASAFSNETGHGQLLHIDVEEDGEGGDGSVSETSLASGAAREGSCSPLPRLCRGAGGLGERASGGMEEGGH